MEGGRERGEERERERDNERGRERGRDGKRDGGREKERMREGGILYLLAVVSYFPSSFGNYLFTFCLYRFDYSRNFMSIESYNVMLLGVISLTHIFFEAHPHCSTFKYFLPS